MINHRARVVGRLSSTETAVLLEVFIRRSCRKPQPQSKEAIFLDHKLSKFKKPYARTKQTNQHILYTIMLFLNLPSLLCLWMQIFGCNWVRIDRLASKAWGQTNRGEHITHSRRTWDKEGGMHNKYCNGVQYQWSPTRQTTVRNRKIKI